MPWTWATLCRNGWALLRAELLRSFQRTENLLVACSFAPLDSSSTEGRCQGTASGVLLANTWHINTLRLSYPGFLVIYRVYIRIKYSSGAQRATAKSWQSMSSISNVLMIILFFRSSGHGCSHDVHNCISNDCKSWSWRLETSHMGLWLVLLVPIGLYLVLPLRSLPFQSLHPTSRNVELICKEWIYFISLLGMQFSNQLFFFRFSSLRLLYRMFKLVRLAFAIL